MAIDPKTIDLDAEIPAAEQDWTPDERRMVILGAEAIANDPGLTIEEQIDFILALINKPLARRLS